MTYPAIGGAVFDQQPYVGGLSGIYEPIGGSPAQDPPAALFLSPGSARSPWNVQTIGPVFDSRTIPTPPQQFIPVIAGGDLSVTAFQNNVADGYVNVLGPASDIPYKGVYVEDEELFKPFVRLRMPSYAQPASGGDGHIDVYDVQQNKIHSFWQCRKVNGVWRAATYSWTAMDGRMFGDPGQYRQGGRAAATPPTCGIIRQHEWNDGQSQYHHALCCSMDYSGLSPDPAYVFPATMADQFASSLNYGFVPEGALLMLPSSFNVNALTTARLRKVARTLQTYGMLVVDQNVGCAYVIYVENGPIPIDVYDNGGQQVYQINQELLAIQAALRMVTGFDHQLDRNGQSFAPTQRLNLLSMRGGWLQYDGEKDAGNNYVNPGVFDTLKQNLTFADNGRYTQQVNGSGSGMRHNLTADPVTGQTFQLSVYATGGATLQFDLNGYHSGEIPGGQQRSIVWPSNAGVPSLTARSGSSGGGTVTATLIRTA